MKNADMKGHKLAFKVAALDRHRKILGLVQSEGLEERCLVKSLNCYSYHRMDAFFDENL